MGLIIVDEEHDQSYKQDEGVIYNARDMAISRAYFQNIPINLITAVPSIETFENVKSKKYKISKISFIGDKKIKYKKKRRIFHNCSGKHCGHLAVSKYKDLPIENYNQNDHPIQKDLIDLIEHLSEYKIKNIGIDGCTLPNPLIPLKKFALAAASLADHEKLNEHSNIAKRIFNSCIKFPEITGGTNSINCLLTKLSKGKIFFKNGAEGVFVAIIPEQKSALAVKIIDGASRAAEVAIAGLISELNIVNSDQIEKILDI